MIANSVFSVGCSALNADPQFFFSTLTTVRSTTLEFGFAYYICADVIHLLAKGRSCLNCSTVPLSSPVM